MMHDIGSSEGNPSTVVTNQVCLRRCMLYLQKLQLWLLGSSSLPSQLSDTLRMPRAWLQLEPLRLPLLQLQHLAHGLFPPSIMSELASPSESALKSDICYDGSAFERHVLLALLHPSIVLPLDEAAGQHASPPPTGESNAAHAPAAWSETSIFMHSLHCLRMAVRNFVQSFSSVGKPSWPDSAEFLKFIHNVQVCAGSSSCEYACKQTEI